MKEKSFRDDLNKILSTKEDPAKVEGVMNRLVGEQEPPIDRRSIPDRLWVLWTRIKEMRTEADDLSLVLREHSGSRLPEVVEHLTQAENLTSETMSETTGQTPSEKYRISDRGEHWEIWDDSVGVGIRFRKWGKNSGRNLLFIRSEDSLYSEDDLSADLTFDKLVDFARERFPQEFGSED